MMLSQRHKQLIGRYASLLLAGIALQFFVGEVNPSFMSYPWTLVVAVNYLYILILLYSKSDSMKCIRRLYDRPAYLSSLVSILVLTLFFGMIRQDGSTGGVWGLLGFNRMATSWIFVFFLFHFTTVIGLKAIEDVYRWQHRKWSAVVMHVSFFIILASAIFGSGDKVRVKVTTALDTPIGVGMTANGEMYSLPFILTLKEFVLEEYPPQVYVIDGKEVVMPRREVKKFLSRVEVANEDGTKEVEVLVNHPARIGAWKIYQSGYDSARDKQSSISILECVKDSWYPMIHVAMWMILVGGVMMFVLGFKKKGEDKK